MIRVAVLVLLLSGCQLFGGGVAPPPPPTITGDNAQVQQQSAQAGSTAQAKEIGEVTTINEDGLDPWMWLLIGMLLPMPKFMRVIF